MAEQERTGVKFVAEDIKKYLQAFADANKAIEENIEKVRELVDAHAKADEAQRGFAEGVKALVAGLTGGAGAVLGFAGMIKNILGKALNLVLAPIKAFVGSLRRVVEIAGGFLLRDAIRGLANLINDLQQAVIRAAADFEQLEVRMQTMIARSARLSGAVTDITKSFEVAEGPAKRMMRWVEEMALISPIDPEAITTVLTFAQTMNLGQQASQDLTRSILEFTTAMGFSSEVAERIIINFLQMQKVGKITGRELTDLARGAMVPTNDVLRNIAETLGLASDEWNKFVKDVKAGRVPVEDFLESFKTVVARDFPEAFERMSNTLNGSINRLKNWAKVVIGFRVLGPVTEEIGKLIGNLVAMLSQDEIKAIASGLGVVLQKAFIEVKKSVSVLFQSIKELTEAMGIATGEGKGFARVIVTIAAFMSVAIERVAAFIDGLRNNLGGGLDDEAEKAEGRGKNIIISLAKGMADATRFILRVIAQIGRILQVWFAPGSPPKIAPYLDVWGAEAMTEYMKGWLSPDFSVFNEISGLVEDFVRSLSTDVVAEKNLIPSILGTRRAITDAINMVREVGKVTTEMVNKVVSSIPNATKAFRDYTRVTLELADAKEELSQVSKIQESLQSEINAINEEYGAILDDLHQKLNRNMQVFDDQNKLEKINESLASGRLTTEEQARLEAQKRDIQLREQIRNVEDQRDAELEAKEARLESIDEEVVVAEQRVAILEKQQSVQESLIKAQTEYNNLIKEQASILSRGGAEEDAGIILPEPATPDLSEFIEDIADFDFETMFADAKANIESLFDDIALEFTGLETNITEIKEAWDGLFSGEGINAEDIARIVEGLGNFVLWTLRVIDTILKANETAHQLMAIFSLLDDWLRIKIAALVKNIIGEVTMFKDKMVELFTFIYNWLVGDSLIPDLINEMKSIIFGGLDSIAGKFTSIKDSVLSIVSNMADGIKSSIANSFKTAKDKAATFAGQIRGIWTGLKNKLVDNSIVPDMMNDIEFTISGGLDNSTKKMQEWSRETLRNTRTASEGVAGAITTLQQAQQASMQSMVAQPSAVTNSRTTNVTVNANYQDTQSPADVSMDVQAALAAAQI